MIGILVLGHQINNQTFDSAIPAIEVFERQIEKTKTKVIANRVIKNIDHNLPLVIF